MKLRIDTRHNYTMILKMDETYDLFRFDVKLEETPHYKIMSEILNHLNKVKGYKATKNPFYENRYKILSIYHRLITINDLLICFELENYGLKIELGYDKNMFNGNNFWGSDDERSKPLSYLDKKRVELEIRRISNFLSQQNVEIQDCRRINLSPEEEILKSKSEGWYSNATSLDQIVNDMSNHDLAHNNNDQNGKKIKNGDVKYFYNPSMGNRLCKGKVYFNLNSSWYVVLSKEIAYVQSRQLFDYTPTLSKRRKLDEVEYKRKIKRLLNTELKNENYDRVSTLSKILSIKHT